MRLAIPFLATCAFFDLRERIFFTGWLVIGFCFRGGGGFFRGGGGSFSACWFVFFTARFSFTHLGVLCHAWLCFGDGRAGGFSCLYIDGCCFDDFHFVDFFRHGDLHG